MIVSRSFLGLPAWAWPAIAAVMIAAAVFVPPPQPSTNPPKVSQIFDPPLLFTIDPDGEHRAVPHQARASVSPIWTVVPITSQQWSVTRQFGFFIGNSTWSYQLTANRFDAGPSPTKDVPEVNATKLRQLAVNELNNSTGGKRTGDTLAHLLDNPLERSSLWCAQNLVVLLAWLAALLAIAAVISMLIVSRSTQPAN